MVDYPKTAMVHCSVFTGYPQIIPETSKNSPSHGHSEISLGYGQGELQLEKRRKMNIKSLWAEPSYKRVIFSGQ